MAACHENDIKEPCKSAVVSIRFFHKTKVFQDGDNILASLKAAWDGFTDAGLWEDDRDVAFMPIARFKDSKNPRVEVTVMTGEFDWEHALSVKPV